MAAFRDQTRTTAQNSGSGSPAGAACSNSSSGARSPSVQSLPRGAVQCSGFRLPESAEGDLTVRNIGRDPSCPRRQRQAEGGTPTIFLKARLKAASAPQPISAATVAILALASAIWRDTASAACRRGWRNAPPAPSAIAPRPWPVPRSSSYALGLHASVTMPCRRMGRAGPPATPPVLAAGSPDADEPLR